MVWCICMCIYIYTYIHVCVCVGERERERGAFLLEGSRFYTPTNGTSKPQMTSSCAEDNHDDHLIIIVQAPAGSLLSIKPQV